MRYDFDQIIDRTGTNSLKWENLSRLYPEANERTLPLWVADMDFAVAQPILDALHQRVERDIFGYVSLDDGYCQAIADWYGTYHNWQIDPATICYAPAVVAGISYLLTLLTAPGDGVIVQPPVYYPFAAKITALGRQVVTNPLRYDDGFYSIDFDLLEQQFQQHKLMIFCSPHNPGGRVWSGDELRRLGELALQNGVTVIVDEIHNDLTRRGVRHQVLASLFPAQEDRFITCVSTSKTFNLAGLHAASIVITDAALRRRWQTLLHDQLCLYDPSPLAIVAVKAAYREGREWLEQVRDYLDGNLQWLHDFCAAALPRAIVPVPQGTYLAWLDLRAYTADSGALARRLLTEQNLLVEDGAIFGTGGAGFLRINCACPRRLLQEAARRLVAGLRP